MDKQKQTLESLPSPVVLPQQLSPPFPLKKNSSVANYFGILGIIQFVLGSVCFAAGIIDMVAGCSTWSEIAAGYWTGFMMIEAGCFSFVTSVSKSKVMVRVTLVFTVIATVLSVCAVTFGALTIREAKTECKDKSDDEIQISKIMGGLLVACGAAELAAGLVCLVLSIQVLQWRQVQPEEYLGFPPEYRPVTYYTALGEAVHLFQYSPARSSDTALLPLPSLSELQEEQPTQDKGTVTDVHLPEQTKD